MPATRWSDHFSSAAADYALYRPGYPAELFEYLAEQTPRRRLAWDCASGSGQAAIGLLPLFDAVVASDASLLQLQRFGTQGIGRVACRAEHAALRSGTVDLVVIAQALHWFEREPFFLEVERVARPGAVLAAWTYSLMKVDEAIDRILHTLAEQTLGPYWPPERAHVDNAYRDFVFPFESQPTPSFDMQATWSLQHVLGYLGTWSSVRRFRCSVGADPLEAVAPVLADAWGSGPQLVRWPLHLHFARKRC